MLQFKVHNRLRTGYLYAVSINVSNPMLLPAADSSWYLWTLDAQGSLVDGSQEPAPLAPGFQSSWRLYPKAWPSAPVVYLESHSLRPRDVFRVLEILVVSNIRVPGTGTVDTSLRVIAPSGCSFEDPSAVPFELFTNTSTEPLLHAALVRTTDRLLWL